MSPLALSRLSRRPSSFRLRVTRRSATSWTSWSAKRTTRRLAKRERRLLLLRLATDRQLLLVKESQQQLEQLAHRRQELTESQQFREQGILPPEPTMLTPGSPLHSLTPQDRVDLQSGLDRLRNSLPSSES